MAQVPGRHPAHRRRGRDAPRGPAADARRLHRDDRVPDRAPLLAPAAHVAARDDRDRLAPQAARARGEAGAARPPDPGLRLRALRREGLPRPEDVLDRGPRRGRADDRRGLRDGPHRGRATTSSSGWPTAAGSASSPTTSAARRARSWPSSRARRRSRPSRPSPRSRPAAPATSSTTTATAARTRPATARRSRSASIRTRATSSSSTPSSPAPPGRADEARRREDRARPLRSRAGAAPRRRGVPRPGGGRRDLQPPVARRLRDRRHDPHHPGQPDRLHDRAPGGPLDPVRGRHGEGLQRPDHPRERRRPRGLRRRRPAGDGLPRALGPRRRHRPDRLPPLRPQRDRRARLHPAADGGEDQGAPAGLPALRRVARQGGDRQPRGRRGEEGGAPDRRSSRATTTCARRSRPATSRTRPRPAPASSTAPAARRSRPPSTPTACAS